MRHLIAFLFSTAILGNTLLSAQQVTARDAFWSASDLVSVSSNPAAKPPVRRVEARGSGDGTTPGNHHIASHAPPNADTAGKAGAGQSSSGDIPGSHLDPSLVASNGYGVRPHLVRVSPDQIGLRYSLLLRDAEGSYTEVSSRSVFHSGDHLRLTVMANQPGYLYVIQQGSTGSWSPIFPAPQSAREVNRVEQGRVYQVPNERGAFQFDENAGQERLFIVLSRSPIHDLDTTIKGLKRPGDVPGAVSPERPELAASGRLEEASNHIPDELVQRLASRDLMLIQEQQVDLDPKGPEQGEKAVYVVSKGAKAKEAEVVSSVTLRHE